MRSSQNFKKNIGADDKTNNSKKIAGKNLPHVFHDRFSNLGEARAGTISLPAFQQPRFFPCDRSTTAVSGGALPR